MPDTPSLSQLMEPPDTPGRFTCVAARGKRLSGGKPVLWDYLFVPGGLDIDPGVMSSAVGPASFAWCARAARPLRKPGRCSINVG
jgi:hypothetical protein